MPARKVMRLSVFFGVLVSGLISCSPLPGRTLDPMFPAVGPPTERGRGQPSESWIGHYRDSRGEGELSLILTQEQNTLRGNWRRDTGDAGQFAGTLAADGQTLAFTLRGSDPRCPAAFAGRGEFLADRITGIYTGNDCSGAVSDGILELTRK